MYCYNLYCDYWYDLDKSQLLKLKFVPKALEHFCNIWNSVTLVNWSAFVINVKSDLRDIIYRRTSELKEI
jgi:hypothetical protein